MLQVICNIIFISSPCLNDHLTNCLYLCKIILDGKQFNLPSSEVEKIVADDIKFRQALITADFTRSLYSESCRFQDEIDVYPIDDYVRGTKLLFNPALSHVDLIGPVTTVSDSRYARLEVIKGYILKYMYIHYIYLDGLWWSHFKKFRIAICYVCMLVRHGILRDLLEKTLALSELHHILQLLQETLYWVCEQIKKIYYWLQIVFLEHLSLLSSFPKC